MEPYFIIDSTSSLVNYPVTKYGFGYHNTSTMGVCSEYHNLSFQCKLRSSEEPNEIHPQLISAQRMSDKIWKIEAVLGNFELADYEYDLGL